MKKRTILTACVLLSLNASAAGLLTDISIDENAVYFSTEEAKSDNSPSCMLSENNDKWTLSLASDSGKASYALLVAAFAENRKITVISAQDCGDVVGFERAKSINVGPVENISISSSTEFVPIFFSGSLQVASGLSGEVLTIVPPKGQRVRLHALAVSSSTGAENDVSVFVGSQEVIQSLTLVGASTSVIGRFSITNGGSNARSDPGNIPYLQGKINEAITVVKNTGSTQNLIKYSYSFSY